MQLIFQNSNKEERIIAIPNTKEEVISEINKFLEKHDFKSYYKRVWECEGRLRIDVGSHSEFFIVEGITFDKWIGDWTDKQSLSKK